MNLEIDYNELRNLIQQMVDWGGDESGFYHVANYLLDCVYEQYPELEELANERFK